MMAKALFSRYRRQNLKELIDLLKADYYDAIANNCINITQLINALQHEEQTPPDQLYISLCIKLVNEVKHNVHLCEVIVVPYIYELHEKTATSHNCANCSGNCNMHHSLQLKGIKAAHEKIKDILCHIDDAVHPEQMPVVRENGACKVLRNEIVCLDTVLTELFYLEEEILIPKIIAAQTEIHAVI